MMNPPEFTFRGGPSVAADTIIQRRVDSAGYGDDSDDVAQARTEELARIVGLLVCRLPAATQVAIINDIAPEWEPVE